MTSRLGVRVPSSKEGLFGLCSASETNQRTAAATTSTVTTTATRAIATAH